MERKPASYADLEALSDSIIGELVAGTLYASPRPAGPHTLAASRLGIALGGPFDQGRGGPGEVFRLEGEHYSLLATHAGLARVRAEPFDAIELELAFFWGES